MGFQLYCMKILADLGLQRETIKQVSRKAFIFFQKSSDLFQFLFGKVGKCILVFDELQILAGFESCSWQYCFRLALKQNYKTGYIAQAGHGFKLLIRSVCSGICGGSGSPSTVRRLCPAVSYPLAGGCAALLSIWVQNEYVWMGAVSQKRAGLGCFLHLQVGSALFPCALKSLCCLL